MSDRMTPERWRQVTEVFHAALARDASARASYLDQACAGDRALRDEVDAMLAAHHDGHSVRQIAGDASLTHMPRLDIRRDDRSVSRCAADRRRRHGRGLSRARHQARTRCGHQGPAAAFTSDADRLARFEREARMLAALNHPHIARDLRLRRGRRHACAGAGAGGGRDARGSHRAGPDSAAIEALHDRAADRARRSKPRTSKGSFIAI